MAAPLPTTYYIGLATALGNVGVYTTSGTAYSWTELSGGSYARLACGFTGTAMSGLTQTTTAWVVATAPTPAVPILYGLVFDSLTGGNLIAYWTWSQPYTTSLTAMPIQVINITFNTYIQVALNMALLGGQGSSGSLIDAGAQLGTMGGNPMLAGSRLGIGIGGSLVAHLGTGQWIGSADVQGSLNFGSLATNNINTGITALAGGANSTLTPTLTGFVNKITVCATSLDSVILPAATTVPSGSLLTVINRGAAAAKVFADTGSAINSAATSLVVGIGTSCIFVRTGSTQWDTIPLLPS